MYTWIYEFWLVHICFSHRHVTNVNINKLKPPDAYAHVNFHGYSMLMFKRFALYNSEWSHTTTRLNKAYRTHSVSSSEYHMQLQSFLFYIILAQCSIFILLEHVRKPKWGCHLTQKKVIFGPKGLKIIPEWGFSSFMKN